MSEWISVNEHGYPCETMDTLVVNEYGNISIARFMAPTGAWWGKGLNDCKVNVTHWMPLPEPPKEYEHETV